MEKIETSTPDITEENIEKIIELFPHVATEVENAEGELERTIDFDVLRDLLGDVAEGQRERYQFTWPGKREAKAEARRPINKTMIPCPEKSVDWDTTENLYIEGDNLDALKLLKETYAGKIKLIYIDPPYNTGHDFIYDDDYAKERVEYESYSGEYDESGWRLVANPEGNGRFHSDWCSMLYPRLLVARDLLSSDGALFMSIDFHENTNARKILDDVFGPDGYIAEIACVNKPSGRSDDKYIATAHESILIYRKSDDFIMGGFEPEDNITSRYSRTMPDGRKYRYEDLRKRGTNDERINRPNLFYPFFYNQDTGDLVVGDNENETPNGYIRIVPMKTSEIEGNWRWGKETAKADLAHLHAVFMTNKNQGSVHEVQYLDERGDVKPTSVWAQKDVNSERGTESFVGLGFPSTVFQNPKPIGTLQRILRIATDRDSLILDFFSGSGSMAQAVMESNKKDCGKRKYIMVQLPEETQEDSSARANGFNDICEIGEERIRRSGKKVVSDIEAENQQLELGEEPKPFPDIGFRVLRIDSSNFKNTFMTPGQATQTSVLDAIDNVKEGRTAEDILFEVLPAFRIPYSAHIETMDVHGKKVFDVNYGQLLACFDEDVTNDVIEEIARCKPSYAVMRDLSFKDDSASANFEELFKTFSPDTIRRVI